jgi:nicotinamide-nucleotide amidase
VDLRLTARGMPPGVADRQLSDGAAILRARLGEVVYAGGRTDLASVVLDLCRGKELTVAVAESCTGGLLGSRLTDIPGASDVFLGGVIVYHNDAKESLAGVSGTTLSASGAVSEATALELAAGARRRLGASIGIGITGMAGPGGGTPEKPVGLVWLAVDDGSAARSLGARLIGDRREIRFRATQAALDLTRRQLLGLGLPEWPGGAVRPLLQPK